MTLPARPLAEPVKAVPATTTSGSPGWMAAVLFVALFAVYLSNLRVMTTGDSIPTRLLPFSIVREGNLNLDEFGWLWSDHLPYYIRYSNGHLYSGTTIAAPLLVIPLYVVPSWLLTAYDVSYDDVRARVLIVVMERISAATLTALSAVLLYGVLLRLVSWQWALALTLTYALGTNTWVVSSQALWPHTLSELGLVVLSAIFLGRAQLRTWALLLAGFTVAVMLANRPQTLGFGLLAALYVWNHHRARFLAFAALPLAGAAAVAAYNINIFSGLAGAYVTFQHFSTPPLEGLAGLLLSPNRGLLVYTPIMAFALWGATQVWQASVPAWMRYLVLGLGWHLLLYSLFNEWWAGYTYGPRYLTDVLPVLTLLLVYGWVPWCRTRAARVVTALLVLYGVGVQAVGVYMDDDGWNRGPVPLEIRPQRVWDWSDWQVARAARGKWRGGELRPLIADMFHDSVPAVLGPVSEADMTSVVQAESLLPTRLPPETRTRVEVAVQNRGRRAWPAFTGDIKVRHSIVLVVRWLSNGAPMEGTGDVLLLPQNVMPGESIKMDVPLTAPAAPGDYQVDLRIAQALDGSSGTSSADALQFPVKVE